MPAPRVAVMPGTFDPITYGHLDIIGRGAGLFDGLIVGVSENAAKAPLLPTEERLRLIEVLVAPWPNVRVETFSGMTADFAHARGACVILRGIRTYNDFEYEFQLALANRLVGHIETVFVMASAENAFVRSTLIKEAAMLGADMTSLIPPEVAESLRRFRYRSGRLAPSVGLGGQEVPPAGKRGSGLRGEGPE